MARRYCILVLCLPLLILLVGCSAASEAGGSSGSSSSQPSRFSASRPATNACNNTFDSTGGIVDIGSGTSITMEGTVGKALQDSRYIVYIDQQTTKIYDNRQQECRIGSFTDLQKGQRIAIQSTGVALQSYPPQITATEIVILS